jgi:hypothetical protein
VSFSICLLISAAKPRVPELVESRNTVPPSRSTVSKGTPPVLHRTRFRGHPPQTSATFAAFSGIRSYPLVDSPRKRLIDSASYPK